MKVEQNKPHSIHLRLTDEQYEFLKADATMLGVGLSDYVRMIINTTMYASKKVADQIKNQMQLGDLAQNENTKNTIEHLV